MSINWDNVLLNESQIHNYYQQRMETIGMQKEEKSTKMEEVKADVVEDGVAEEKREGGTE